MGRRILWVNTVGCEACDAPVAEDGAEVLVLGCTCEFGFHDKVQQALGVPVIDAVYAPLKLAEHMAGLKRRFGWTPSRVVAGA